MILSDIGVSSPAGMAAARRPYAVSKTKAFAPATIRNATFTHQVGLPKYCAGWEIQREADERPRHELFDDADRHALHETEQAKIEHAGDAEQQRKPREMNRLAGRPEPRDLILKSKGDWSSMKPTREG
jgi:hypothetical protein